METKNIKTKNNSITTKPNGVEYKQTPSFSAVNKELCVKLINTLNGLSNLSNSNVSKDELISLAEKLLHRNEELIEDYSNKYIQSIYENNEIYTLFKNTLKAKKEQLKKEFLHIDSKLKTGVKEIDESLLLFQQEAISKYKTLENIFLQKARYLETNKKTSKDEYIKSITTINHNRIRANQDYINKANDLSSINEQQQLKFKHSIESSIEKNTYDKSIIAEDTLEKINNYALELEALGKEQRQTISIKERQIIENTVEINNQITKLSNKYENRLKYAYIPYDIKSNNFIDELAENEKTYNSVEEQVLIEFKAMLQENDIEIEELKEAHKIFENQYLKKLREIKKAFNSTLQKDINIIDKNISIATKNYTSSKTKEDKNIIKKLVAEKKKFIKEQAKLKQLKINELRETFYLYEIEYIEKYEQLRSKKSECEAIKSSAVKNINYERVYHHERINNEIKLVNSEKETFASTDHYEEIKEIYETRFKIEVENEKIRFQINEIELQIFKDSVNIKYKQDRILAEKEYNLKLCDADLIYQQESIKNRINYFNVKVMLDIQKEKLINEFEVMFANEKMNFEQIKHNFYNACDNMQYELLKNSNEYKYKIIDEDVKEQQKLAEVNKHHLEAVNTFEKLSLSNELDYEENMLQINLYESRLEIEKNMLLDAYESYSKILNTIIEFENYLHSVIINLNSQTFKENKKEILISLEHIRMLKLEALDYYLNNEKTIINTRLNFVKTIKFKKQIENAYKEYDEFIEYSNQRIQKNNETIASYENAIFVSTESLKKTRNEISSLRKLLIKTIDNDEIENILKELRQHKENVILLEKQIKTNRKNIYKLQQVVRKQKIENKQKEKKFLIRFEKINKTHYSEAKIYNKITSLIETQHKKISNQIVCCGQYSSASKYDYDIRINVASKIREINNKIFFMAENNFEIHYKKFDEFLSKINNIQRDACIRNHERFLKETEKTIKIEQKEYQTNISTIINAHKSNVDTLERKNKYQENKLLLELEEIIGEHELNLTKHNQTMAEIENRKKYELDCHDENEEMYLKIYNDTNSNIIKKYLLTVKQIKSSYHEVLINLTNKYKQTLKRIKGQHISNITLEKNNITNLNNEYKNNIKNTNIKIKKVVQEDKKKHYRHDENKKISYKLYLLNQKNTRKEFAIQTKEIKKKCNARIIQLVKEFKKEFKIKKD